MEKGRPPLVLAVDVGTSSVRALLFDGRGRPCGPGSRLTYAASYEPEGAAQVDPEHLLWLTEEVMTRAVADDAEPVAAVGLSTFWHSLVGVDARGRPTTPVFLWSDARAWRQAERLRRELDREGVRRRTGAPIHPCYWPARLAWLRQEQPAIWERTRRWLSFPDLLYLRLFGEVGTSPSMASGTGLRRLAGGWDPALLELLAVDPEALPREVEEMSGLRPTYARRWPRLRAARWLTACGDGALANLGSGCVDPTRRAITLGTSGALRVITDRPPSDLTPGLWCYVLDAERYVVGGALSNGGNLWAWMRRTLRLKTRGLEYRLAQLPPGSGPDFLPLLAGERSPGFAPHASGAIAGLTQTTTAEQIVRSGMEGVAVRFAMIDAALDRSVPGAKLLVASGGALHASRLWAQIIADAIGKPIRVSPDFEASARGAAWLALARLGIHVQGTPHRGRLVEPDGRAHRAYAEVAARQARLYTLLIEGSKEE
jgi:gluconokinase